jgi:hypothetical protein
MTEVYHLDEDILNEFNNLECTKLIEQLLLANSQKQRIILYILFKRLNQKGAFR